MKSRMSIVGLYNYDSTIFDDMKLPPEIKREILIENILTELAPLSVIFPSVPFFKRALKNWSEINFPIWTKIIELMAIEYNPIENYDRSESVSRTTQNSVDSRVQSDGDSNGTSTALGRSMNDATMKETAKNSTQGKEVNSTGTTGTSGGVETVEAHTHGNIGITTNQQMLTAELALRDFSIYRRITEDFKHKFCVMVY